MGPLGRRCRPKIAGWKVRGLQYLRNLLWRTKAGLLADKPPIEIEEEELTPAAGADCNLAVIRKSDRETTAFGPDKPAILKSAVVAVVLHALSRHGGGQAASVRQADCGSFEEGGQLYTVQRSAGIRQTKRAKESEHSNQ